MTPEEFKAKWSAKIPALGGSVGAPTQGTSPAPKSGASTGASAANQAKAAQAKAAVAPSQADTSQAPLPKSASATTRPVPTLSPGSFTGPPPEAAPPTPISPKNIAANLYNATPWGQAGKKGQEIGTSIGEGLVALPEQARSLKDKLYERAMAEARRLSATPQ